jgi:hypothetical protein
VKVDVGFAKEAPVLGIFGMNVYHKNRLIMVRALSRSGIFSFGKKKEKEKGKRKGKTEKKRGG